MSIDCRKLPRGCLSASKWFNVQRPTSHDEASKSLPRKLARMASKGHRLLLSAGFIEYAGGRGFFQIMPGAQRSLNKLMDLISAKMALLDAQQLTLSSLIPRKLWESSGRWESSEKDLLKVIDRDGMEFCLGPTHEEVVTSLFSSGGLYEDIGERRLPLYLYQMTSKFRNEAGPRYGFLRSREFLMKDLYTFDKDSESALATFNRVLIANECLLAKLLLPVYRVQAATGNIGGTAAVEYHLPCGAGQDYILHCEECGYGINEELICNKDKPSEHHCPSCKVSAATEVRNLKRIRSIEIAHTFLLGQHYSSKFHACYRPLNDTEDLKLLEMCCSGIGVTRLLTACVDYLSTSSRMRFPYAIVPFKVCLIPPKRGSFEEKAGADSHALDLASLISGLNQFRFDCVLDDRTSTTVGKRINEADFLGIPFVIVANKTAASAQSPKFELIDNRLGTSSILDPTELLSVLCQLDAAPCNYTECAKTRLLHQPQHA